MKRLSLQFHVHPFILAGFFVVLLLSTSWAFGLLINEVKGIQTFDRAVYAWIQGGPHPAWLNGIVAPFNFNFFQGIPSVFLSFLVVVVVLCLTLIFLFKRKDFGWALLACLIAVIIDQVIAQGLPALFFRPRPFNTLPHNLTQQAIDIWNVWPSFPSGHTRDTTIFMTVLAAFMPKGWRWPMAAFCVFIAWTRVYVGAHFPTDVIAGLFIGYFLGKIALSMVEEIRKVNEGRKQRKNEAAQQAAA